MIIFMVRQSGSFFRWLVATSSETKTRSGRILLEIFSIYLHHLNVYMYIIFIFNLALSLILAFGTPTLPWKLVFRIMSFLYIFLGCIYNVLQAQKITITDSCSAGGSVSENHILLGGDRPVDKKNSKKRRKGECEYKKEGKCKQKN